MNLRTLAVRTILFWTLMLKGGRAELRVCRLAVPEKSIARSPPPPMNPANVCLSFT